VAVSPSQLWPGSPRRDSKTIQQAIGGVVNSLPEHGQGNRRNNIWEKIKGPQEFPEGGLPGQNKGYQGSQGYLDKAGGKGPDKVIPNTYDKGAVRKQLLIVFEPYKLGL